MALMRHGDRRLTDKVYTDENLPGTWGAIDLLPSYEEGASQIASQILGVGRQNVTTPVTGDDRKKSVDQPEMKRDCRVLSLPFTSSQLKANGGSGGARTRNLCRDRAAL